MPNVGRPSRDCHLCRQRRVKCDLTQPECIRCTRLGKKCPGYRDESDLLFRVENPASFADGTTRDRRRKHGGKAPPDARQHSTAPAQSSENEGGPAGSTNTGGVLIRADSQDTVIFSGWYLTPSRNSAECWDSQALPLCLSNIRAPVQHRMVFGFLGFLPEMIARSGEESSVALTCRAIAQAFITNQLRTPEAQSQRGIAYGKALTSTNAVLRDPALQTQDETLTCVWLLSLYELIVGSSSPTQNVGPVTWNVHTQGLVSLLRLRGTSHFSTPIERNLFWLVYNTVQIRCFIAGVECPPESLEWLQALQTNLRDEEMHLHRVCVYGYHASFICAKIRTVISQGIISSPNPSLKLLAEAETLEREVNEQLISLPQVLDTNALGPELGETRLNVRDITVRTFYCAFRLKTHLTVIELLDLIRLHISGIDTEMLENQCQHHVMKTQMLADEILAGVPFLYQSRDAPAEFQPGRPRYWTDGLRLLWPLRLVAYWRSVREDQRRVAGSFLRHIKEELGIQQATEAFIPGTLNMGQDR
ncbi:uncharacterized protein Z518_02812 [Rhinocladiella mackenziei CBS 650.93]|uniref:Zn(2)-C6 fungal-type domain-containing protein n=1 Tax=Rhinocladiella mackenziei CBS 650.93 TaxID=1442369 RepID=A0A0D2IXR1_9EURO|nr:uncharacterized protein Z518_02812 [Rhinocladiella mackenziei CBS 650.93]KIX08156.1 hypothetical protein Z518_02812 [Rhinocladiella mackenziei CBS 650.93]